MVWYSILAGARHNVRRLAKCGPVRRAGCETRERFTFRSSLGRKYVSKLLSTKQARVQSSFTGEKQSQKTETTQGWRIDSKLKCSYTGGGIDGGHLRRFAKRLPHEQFLASATFLPEKKSSVRYLVMERSITLHRTRAQCPRRHQFM